MTVESFALIIGNARSLMNDGRYLEAFELIVDQEVQSLADLLDKIECLVDIGFILRDEKMLRYGLYLLEKHGDEVLEVRELAPRYFLNLAHQYANMVTLNSFADEYYGFFERAEQVKARRYYRKVLSFPSLSDETAFEAWTGLAQMYQSSGRGLEALEAYQEALRIRPSSREVLHEKIRLMKEYALSSLPNRVEFLQEARALLDKSVELREDGDDQEDIILRNRLLECGLDRDTLDRDGEYPVSTVDRGGREERSYIEFCIRNRLYLNLCGFCRRCEFAMGDSLGLSSSSLTIRQGQKKRFVTLRQFYGLMRMKYREARFQLAGLTGAVERDRSYMDRAFFSDPERDKEGEGIWFSLAAQYRSLWSLWDDGAAFIALFQGGEHRGGMGSLFYRAKEIRSDWKSCRSPSLHAVFDLYADCCGADEGLAATAEALSSGLSGYGAVGRESLERQCLSLLGRINLMLQYLAIMHERNEISETNWDFPRPLYNFVSIKEDNESN